MAMGPIERLNRTERTPRLLVQFQEICLEAPTSPLLPYDHAALEPHIDARTMMLHHDKHHASYVTNLNAALEKFPELHERSASWLLLNLAKVPEAARTAVRNNAGGHFGDLVTCLGGQLVRRARALPHSENNRPSDMSMNRGPRPANRLQGGKEMAGTARLLPVLSG
jgi:hypothetical protein